jgi:hypothetical protein
MRSALTFRNSRAIERKPECVRQVVDFSLVFCRSGDAIAGAPVFIDADRPDLRPHLSEETLCSVRCGPSVQAKAPQRVRQPSSAAVVPPAESNAASRLPWLLELRRWRSLHPLGFWGNDDAVTVADNEVGGVNHHVTDAHRHADPPEFMLARTHVR